MFEHIVGLALDQTLKSFWRIGGEGGGVAVLVDAAGKPAGGKVAGALCDDD
jgi:hypothetical protein